ncbi:MAG: hypothetical protein JJU11_09930, partial [Candidatus Sumerlaeia bacterium]|nr:hypothetical protein [Candidatus Sumerlaeia bacterium]
MVAMNDTVPNAAVMTHRIQGDDLKYHAAVQMVLAKISAMHRDQPALIATSMKTEDFPGGIRSSWHWGTTQMEATIAPILTERRDGEWSGAVIYTIKSMDGSPVSLRIGGGFTEWFHLPPNTSMLTDVVTEPGDGVKTLEPGLHQIIRPGKHDHVVLVRAEGATEQVINEDESAHLILDFPQGSGSIIIAFADTKDHARRLITGDPTHALNVIDEYYNNLHESAFIRTPEGILDAAFQAAVTVNEYCWFEPYGWIEGIHHWVTFWHQQHAGMAHWLGQHERARSTLLEIASRQFENGRIPHLEPTGNRRSDFGGANHFFAWQVLVYHRATGDGETVAKLLPCLRRMLQNTEEEYDPE